MAGCSSSGSMSSGAVIGTTRLSSSSMAASRRAARALLAAGRAFFTGAAGGATTRTALVLAFLALVWFFNFVVMILLRISYLKQERNSLHKIVYRKTVRMAYILLWAKRL